MRLCKDTITVLNAGMDKNGYDSYNPTIVHGVSWFCEIASDVDASGLKAANKFIIRIPLEADFSGKVYVSPVDYKGGDPKTIFTLKQGDIIIHGEEPELMDLEKLREKYGEIVTVLGVTDNTKRPRARHWKVIGA